MPWAAVFIRMKFIMAWFTVQRQQRRWHFSDDVFVINSFSKYFGMTGWRIGWLIVPDEFVDATEKLAQNIFIATSTQSQYAALAAFDEDTLG